MVAVITGTDRTVISYKYKLCVISMQTTFKALSNIKPKKASRPHNTPAYVLKYHTDLLAPPLTPIFNC